MTMPIADDYPVRFAVDYPEEPRNRVTVAFRIFLAVPILVLISTFGQLTFGGGAGGWRLVGGTALLFGPVLLMLLFRQKYPRWWFDWNLQFTRFSSRVGAYMLLLRDEYPSTDEEQAVHLEIDYPDATQLNRWLPLVKWLLAVPHLIVLIFLGLAVVLVTLFAWIVVLFTGGYPRGLFDFVVGVQRWSLRVTAYAFLLVTDRYPPFSTR